MISEPTIDTRRVNPDDGARLMSIAAEFAARYRAPDSAEFCSAINNCLREVLPSSILELCTPRGERRRYWTGYRSTTRDMGLPRGAGSKRRTVPLWGLRWR